jgi:PilZ domain-containing protein
MPSDCLTVCYPPVPKVGACEASGRIPNYMVKVTDAGATERRKHKRHPSFIKAELNSQPVTVLDASLGGIGGTIELRGDIGDVPEPGERATVVLQPDSDQPIVLTVEVKRVGQDLNLFGAQIIEMSEDQFELMKQLYAGRPR